MAPSNPTTVAMYGTIGGHGPCVVGAADLPMEVEGKATGRAAMAHVGCCVFCVLCMV